MSEKTEIGIKSNIIKKRTKRGGKRPGSGRKAGVPNKVTIELKKVAAVHGEDAINTIVEIMNDLEVPANVRIAAASMLLDRGFGKPKMELELSGEIGHIDKSELDERYSKNMERTAELARMTKDRIELLKKGALH